MSRLDNLIEDSAQIAALGVMNVTLTREAAERPGQSSLPAMVSIKTSMPRPIEIGGGVVEWLAYVNCSDQHESLNALLRLVTSVINDAAVVAATVRNAYENRRAAEDRAQRTDAKLAKVLHGDRTRGQLLVRTTETGQAWLLDPVKKDAGIGFMFPSLGDLWRAHPDLRPVRWHDGDLIVESWSYEARS